MYIEMTTFAIPTFFIGIVKFITIAVIAWLVLGIIGMAIYSWTVSRAIERRLKIEAEIDRLHK